MDIGDIGMIVTKIGTTYIYIYNDIVYIYIYICVMYICNHIGTYGFAYMVQAPRLWIGTEDPAPRASSDHKPLKKQPLSLANRPG